MKFCVGRSFWKWISSLRSCGYRIIKHCILADVSELFVPFVTGHSCSCSSILGMFSSCSFVWKSVILYVDNVCNVNYVLGKYRYYHYYYCLISIFSILQHIFSLDKEAKGCEMSARIQGFIFVSWIYNKCFIIRPPSQINECIYNS